MLLLYINVLSIPKVQTVVLCADSGVDGDGGHYNSCPFLQSLDIFPPIHCCDY